jgi:uncharacterized protein (TIGR02145 family)
LTAANGTTSQTVTGTTLATSALTITPTTIKDKTECPGVFCPYQGSDLYIDATHLCQQRTSGAKNWEAYIKDSRDNNLYRIVKMPDNNWWLAQNVRYAATGLTVTISGCTPEICGRWYSSTQANASYGGTSGYGSGIQGICSNGWIMPVDNDWSTLINSINSTDHAAACRTIQAIDYPCTDTDKYGWANKMRVCDHEGQQLCDAWASNSSFRSLVAIPMSAGVCSTYWLMEINGPINPETAVRCFRQL